MREYVDVDSCAGKGKAPINIPHVHLKTDDNEFCLALAQPLKDPFQPKEVVKK